MATLSGEGETQIPGGFCRRTRFPPPTASARLRAQLLTIARGASNSVRDGLTRIASWDHLVVLMNDAWFGGLPLRDVVTARRAIERRLRALGTRVMAPSEAALSPWGQLVVLCGRARKLADQEPLADIWLNRTEERGNVRLLVEEGHDFFLEDELGAPVAVVLAAGGHLIGGDRLTAGDRAEVLGFVDHTVDPRRRLDDSSARAPARCLALRSGDELTLLVKKLPATAAGMDGR